MTKQERRKAREEKRHNKANERETRRHHRNLERMYRAQHSCPTCRCNEENTND